MFSKSDIRDIIKNNKKKLDEKLLKLIPKEVQIGQIEYKLQQTKYSSDRLKTFVNLLYYYETEKNIPTLHFDLLNNRESIDTIRNILKNTKFDENLADGFVKGLSVPTTSAKYIKTVLLQNPNKNEMKRLLHFIIGFYNDPHNSWLNPLPDINETEFMFDCKLKSLKGFFSKPIKNFKKLDSLISDMHWKLGRRIEKFIETFSENATWMNDTTKVLFKKYIRFCIDHYSKFNRNFFKPYQIGKVVGKAFKKIQRFDLKFDIDFSVIHLDFDGKELWSSIIVADYILNNYCHSEIQMVNDTMVIYF